MKRVSFAHVAQAAIAAALLALAQPAEAKTTIEFCNTGNTALSMVTIGDGPRGGWAIGGWQTIPEGDCLKVDTIFKLTVGFGITASDGRRGMQVYDPTISTKILAPVHSSYCVRPAGDFRRWHDTMLGLAECQAGDVLARFALCFKPMPGEDVTVRIPADKNGQVIPFEEPKAVHSFPPFQPYSRLFPPDASYELAMRGLAEQQERLRFRIERLEPSRLAYWRVFYFRDLGIVARPETHAVAVAKGSPADKAGLRIGDEILRIDDISVQSAWHARSLLVRTKPGEIRTLTFLRNAEPREQAITLGALPAHLAATELHPKRGWLGIEFESAARVVAAIHRDGTPHLEIGDDIMKIGRTDFDGVDGLARWLARDVESATVELQVRRRATGKIGVMIIGKLK